MKSIQRYTLLLILFTLVAMLAFSSAASVSTQGKKDSNNKAGAAKKKADDPRKSVERTMKQLQKTTGDQNLLKSSILVPDDNDSDDVDDPDLPPWMAGRIDKEAYLRLRGDYID